MDGQERIGSLGYLENVGPMLKLLHFTIIVLLQKFYTTIFLN